MTKCGYCDADSTGVFCDSKCEVMYRNYEKFEKKYTWPFLICILLSASVASLSIFGFPLELIFIGFAFMGLTATVLPLVTSQTITLVGVKKALLITRAIGLSLMIAGTVVAILLLYFL